MATVRKVLGILVVFFVVKTIIACDFCECGRPEERLYSIEVIATQTLDNSGATSVISPGPIPKEAFGISVSFELGEIASCPHQMTIFTPAFGCSCDRYLNRLRDSIQSVTITTLNNFDSDHPAGSDISDLFRIKDDFGFFSVNEYDWSKVRFYAIERNLELLLATAPEPGQHAFQVDVVLLDERVLTSTTNEVELE